MTSLNIEECAEFLKIHITTASEMAADGTLPGAKIGKAWVFLLEDLVDYLRAEVRRQQSERQKAKNRNRETQLRVTEMPISTFLSVKSLRKPRKNVPPPLPD